MSKNPTNIRPTELTWEQNNPINYLYSSSDAVEQLRRMGNGSMGYNHRTEAKGSKNYEAGNARENYSRNKSDR